MRSIMLVSIILFSMCFSVLAQQPPNLLEDSYNATIPMKMVGSDFGLSLPDTLSWIVQNPARATQTHSEYTYLQRNAGAGVLSVSGETIPAVLVGGLLRTEKTSWVYSLGLVSAQTDFDAEFWERRELATSQNVDYDEYDNSLGNDGINVKLNRVSGTSNAGQSYGVFSKYYQGKENRQSDYYSFDSYEYTSSTNREYRTDSQTDISQFKTFVFGGQYTWYNKNTDGVISVGYRHSEETSRKISNSTRVSVDTLFNNSSNAIIRINNLEESNVKITNESDVFFGNAFLQKSLTSWFDHFFIRVSGNYSMADYQYNYRNYDKNERLEDNVVTSSDSIIYTGKGKTGPGNWTSLFALGVTKEKSVGRFYGFTGLQAAFQYTSWKQFNQITGRIYGSVPLPESNKSTLSELSLYLPIYLDYSPRKWVSLFGVLRYKYEYNSASNSINLIEIDRNSPGYKYIDKAEISTQNQNLGVATDFGIRFSYKNIVDLQIDTRGYFDQLASWNLLLQYHF